MSLSKSFKDTNEDEELFQINGGTRKDVKLRTAILELHNAVSTFANAQNEQKAQMNELNRRVEFLSSQFVPDYDSQFYQPPIIPNAAIYGSQLGASQSSIPSSHLEHNYTSQYQHLRRHNPHIYGSQMVGPSSIYSPHLAPGCAYCICQPPIIPNATNYGPQPGDQSFVPLSHLDHVYGLQNQPPQGPNAAIYGVPAGGQPPNMFPGYESQHFQPQFQNAARYGPPQNGQTFEPEDMDVD